MEHAHIAALQWNMRQTLLVVTLSLLLSIAAKEVSEDYLISSGLTRIEW